MKKFYVGIWLALASCLLAVSVLAGQTRTSAVARVYYFHFSHRCITCRTVEAESQKALTVLYPAQYKSGKIQFTSVNMEEPAGKEMAKKCGAEGQALLIFGGNQRCDLTEAGFMYAVDQPERLRAEMKKVIDPLLKK